MSWTREMLAELLEYEGLRLVDVADVDGALAALGRAFPARKRAVAALRRLRRSKRVWTPEEVALLRELYPGASTWELARRLRRSPGQIHRAAAVRGLRKSEAFMAEQLAQLGRAVAADPASVATRFRPGQAPPNKGVKGWQSGGRSRLTQFRKGNRPHTWMPVGAEREIDGYLYRKVSDTGGVWTNDWRLVHHLLWEGRHGPVPEGHALVFRDGDRRNVAVSNLELVSRRELMARNTIARFPPELRAGIRAYHRLRRAIRQMEDPECEPSTT